MLRAGEVIVFPDAVDMACGIVAGLGVSVLGGARVVGRVPSPRPSRFVRILLAGGTRETLTTRDTTLLVEGWAQTESDALRLCEIATAILLSVEGDMFGGREIGAPTLLPDPTSQQERATATVGVRVRGSSLASTTNA